MLAHHASDHLFHAFDPAHLGTHCEEIGADDNVLNACKLGFWFTDEDKTINGETGQKYNYLVDINVDDITDPLMVEWEDIHENLNDGIMAELDKHDVVFVRDTEFHCASYLVRPWALDRIKILEITEASNGGGTVKHFTPDELYDIAMDECRRAGRHIGPCEAEGFGQWAYYSAENDEFHTEEEARNDLRAHLLEEACSEE